jgi:hypothetical protein
MALILGLPSGWQTLGSPSPNSLIDARLQLHHAAQIVTSLGFTFVDAAPDFSHTNLEWDHDLGALVGKPAAGAKAFQGALRFSDPTLLLLEQGPSGRAFEDEYPVAGHTVEEGYAWIESAIRTVTGEQLSKAIVRPSHKIPEHAVGGGGAFSGEPAAAFEEMARWYGNAEQILREIEEKIPEASLVRCWPHHFDIATLAQFEQGADLESGRSVGVGMSPGDAEYPEPYYYVTPWPHPNDPELPPLAGEGHWHSEGWLGAVLPGSQLVSAGGSDAQAQRTADFLVSAFEACRVLAGVTESPTQT